MINPRPDGVAYSVLFLALLPASVLGQQAGSAPPPPPPGQVSAPVLEGPLTDLEPIPQNEVARGRPPAESDAALKQGVHDALKAAVANERASRMYAPGPPPEPVAERPSGRKPSARFVWIPGYWQWDARRSEFVWMQGMWQLPPPGMIWVGGRWVRDQKGWYRVAGNWSPRRGRLEPTQLIRSKSEPAWKTTGPPADHPAEVTPAAPGPDYFYVAGHYEPESDGSRLVWKPGFWTREQPGWEWLPARWVRRPSGWGFRAGSWVPEARDGDAEVRIDGRQRAPRVAPGANARSPDLSADNDRPAPPVADVDSDALGPSNDRLEAKERDQRSVVVVPGPALPLYVIRPPGYYPYGPGGVMVPAIVPRFVRRLLDDVLP